MESYQATLYRQEAGGMWREYLNDEKGAVDEPSKDESTGAGVCMTETQRRITETCTPQLTATIATTITHYYAIIE